MNTQLANARFERKFTPAGWTAPEALAFVRRHPALFHEPYPERIVNNIYFDTPDFRHFHDHIAGTAQRLKVRVRWYGAFGGAIAEPRLEFKLRQGTVSGKETHPFPTFGLNSHFPCDILETVWQDAALPGAVRLRVRGLRPVLGNRYRRRYFRSTNGTVRLTVDWDLEFFAVEGADARVRPLSPRDPTVIIELKYGPADVSAAGAVTAHFPFRLVRYSKYVAGVQRLDRGGGG